MADMMTFPDTVEEFMEQYKITDSDHVYTNGVEMVPIFRMKQWFEHQARTQMSSADCISRQAVRLIESDSDAYPQEWNDDYEKGFTDALNKVIALPSAQPERTCVNCGRTANNGGWYADGRTRCPIEEHYALPKDGYCHLWEKRNVTDDDYPERREE